MQRIIISRTDSIGDVMLTLPLAGYLKRYHPDVEIAFIGKEYTRPIIECTASISRFFLREDSINSPALLKEWNADAILFAFPDKEIAKASYQAKIPLRIGTSHRVFHWQYTNKRVSFTRKKSDLHEAQLNFKLLKGFDIDFIPNKEEIPHWYHFTPQEGLSKEIIEQLAEHKNKIILHPKSKGSAREWPLIKFKELAEQLTGDNHQVIITGTQAEGEKIQEEDPTFFSNSKLINLTGKLSLHQLIALIDKVDALVACSTGPLHIASAIGKKAIGIYPPIKPMHPGRWAPLGIDSHVLVINKTCKECRKTLDCSCIKNIEVREVIDKLLT